MDRRATATGITIMAEAAQRWNNNIPRAWTWWGSPDTPRTTGGAGLRSNPDFKIMMDEYRDRLARETSMYRTLGDENPFAERLALDIQRVQQEDKMENTFKHEIKVVKLDNHYHVSVGCRETIVHDKKEALKWLGKLWDEHIKEE